MVDLRSSPPFHAMFAPDPASIPAARLFVQRPAQQFAAHRVDDIVLAVSELVTNAIEHGSREPFEVRFVRQDDMAELIVLSAVVENSASPSDAPTTSERIRRSGRGLGIVEAISDSFNVQSENGRFRAWCQFNLAI